MFKDRRYLTAMGAYAALALAAAALLEGKILAGVLILFAGLAIKTMIVMASRKDEQ